MPSKAPRDTHCFESLQDSFLLEHALSFGLLLAVIAFLLFELPSLLVDHGAQLFRCVLNAHVKLLDLLTE